MTRDSVKSYTLYKLRFWIGYGLLGIVVLSVLVFAALYVPGGFTADEQQSALTSASLRLQEPTSLLIVDLPYHALQKLSLFLFGLSSFAIKLPSLIIGFLTAIGIVLILRKRFKQTISIIVAGSMVVSAQFIALATTGTADIMTVFWPVSLLLVATYGIRKGTLQAPAVYVGSVIAGLSLFTPFSVYILLALALCGVLHPHIRYLLRKTPRAAVSAGIVILLAALAVAAYAAWHSWTFAAQLLYKSPHFSLNIVENIKLIAMQIVDFASITTDKTGLLAPVFGLSIIAFVLIGIYHLAKWHHSVLSYIVLTWTLLLLPVLVLNPVSLELMIVPFMFLAAAGVSFVLNYWYELFPHNPYARVFALVPVTILFACILLPGAMRYFYAYHYYAPLANQHTYDLQLVAQEISSSPKAILMVASDEKSFYQLYLDTHDNTSTKLVDAKKEVVKSGRVTRDVIATRASELASSTIRPARIVATSELNGDSDRLYIYKNVQK